MKKFEKFSLTPKQNNNTFGKGKPEWAGKPDFENTCSYDADGEWVAPWEDYEGGRKAYNDDMIDTTV